MHNDLNGGRGTPFWKDGGQPTLKGRILTMQKILILSTTGPTLRSEVVGATCEDSDLVDPDREICYARSPKAQCLFRTPLHAMRDGWRLMAPPEEDSREEWEWWFEKL